MAIPSFRADGWLPEGHWQATWEEIVTAFGGAPRSRRRTLLDMLLAWRDSVRLAGITGRLILNGSFVSSKEAPGDCDCLFVYDDSAGRIEDDPAKIVVTDYAALKSSGLGDVFVFRLSLSRKYPELFQTDMFDYDKRCHQRKGVIEVEI